MIKALRRMGKFCSSVIMGNIGIFIFIGILSVIFNETGWLPNEEIYRISQLAYKLVLPVCISFAGGERIGGKTGGILAVLAVTGMLCANVSVGILAGMAAGPAAGAVWKYVGEFLEKHTRSSMQMLVRNLTAGTAGAGLALLGYYFLTPVMDGITAVISAGMTALVERNLTWFLNIIIEPAKVFFLNNIINHGILIPIAVSETEMAGSSILFLLESNPGPGFGMLAALYCVKKTKKEEYASAMIAQGAGGIHEVYFPVVLANLWLLLPLIASGVTGALWFDRMGAGAAAPVSPGSAITFLLMAGKNDMLVVVLGMFLSASVSFIGSMVVLKWQESVKKRKKTETIQIVEEIPHIQEEEKMPINRIGFVCDAGVGSSAMGAAIFRRKLAQNKTEGIQVEAFAADRIPDELDLIVCQKDFYQLIPEGKKEKEIFMVENFVSVQAYDELMELLLKRNGQ